MMEYSPLTGETRTTVNPFKSIQATIMTSFLEGSSLSNPRQGAQIIRGSASERLRHSVQRFYTGFALKTGKGVNIPAEDEEVGARPPDFIHARRDRLPDPPATSEDAGPSSLPSSLQVPDISNRAAVQPRLLPDPVAGADEKVHVGQVSLVSTYIYHAYYPGSTCHCEGHGTFHRSHTSHNARDGRRVYQSHDRVVPARGRK